MCINKIERESYSLLLFPCLFPHSAMICLNIRTLMYFIEFTYLLITYYVPGTMLDAGPTVIRKSGYFQIVV